MTDTQGDSVNDDFRQLLDINLAHYHSVAKENAHLFPEDVLVKYAFGDYEADMAEKARIEANLSRNPYLADRLNDVREYIDYYEIKNFEAYQQQLVNDRYAHELADQRADMFVSKGDELSEQIGSHLSQNDVQDHLSIGVWIMNGPIGLA